MEYGVFIAVVFVIVVGVYAGRKNKKEKATYVYMPIGMCLGMVIGMMFENGLAIGLSIGMAIGLIVGTYMDNKK